MTENKQIIIDGVDVSGCEYCLKMTKYRCAIQRDVYKCLCEENPNCHYKQLAYKTQECEELKRKSEEQSWRYAELDADFEQLKVENEKLKKEIEACYNQVEDFDIIATSKSNKLEQAEDKLERIRDIADEDFCHTCWETYKNQLKQILQIIDEVE